MPLFDDRVRTDSSKIGLREPPYKYYDRVAGETWNRVRRLLNEWTDETLPSEISSHFLDTLRAQGISQAWIFGSVAAGTAGEESDLDLLINFAQPTTLFRQFDLAEALSQICGRDVHLMTRLDPAFEPYIRPELVSLPL